MRLPDFIIIGGQKCGSTSLHYYLNLHPDIAMSEWKELQFFSNPEVWKKGLEWYSSNFPTTAQLTGEASPQYTWLPYAPGTAERMYETVPDAKLIYIVRDPVSRVLSQYNDYIHQSWEQADLDGLLKTFDGGPNLYIETSRYHYQLQEYLKFFPRDRVRIWTMEDLSAEPLMVMREVLEYLEVDSSFTSPKWTEPRNPRDQKRRPHPLVRMLMRKGARPERWVAERFPARLLRPITRWIHATGTKIEKPALNAEQEAELMEHFREDVTRLREYAGREFSNWRSY